MYQPQSQCWAVIQEAAGAATSTVCLTCRRGSSVLLKAQRRCPVCIPIHSVMTSPTRIWVFIWGPEDSSSAVRVDLRSKSTWTDQAKTQNEKEHFTKEAVLWNISKVENIQYLHCMEKNAWSMDLKAWHWSHRSALVIVCILTLPCSELTHWSVLSLPYSWCSCTVMRSFHENTRRSTFSWRISAWSCCRGERDLWARPYDLLCLYCPKWPQTKKRKSAEKKKTWPSWLGLKMEIPSSLTFKLNVR